VKKFILLFILLAEFQGPILFSQIRQTNTNGSDLAADVPFRLKKFNADNQINSIPLHFYVFYSSCFGCNNELIDIKVKLKNATDPNFGNVLTFDTYTSQSFDSLLSCRSQADASWGVQGFNASGYTKDNLSTIKFTSDEDIWGTQYVDITQDYWYFTLNIPKEKLTSYNDIIDIEVNYSLNFESDQQQYFRVFRYNEGLPKINRWYRGDMHYHTYFSQNDVEFGLPVEAAKEAAAKIGLDWITVTDHSSDYDNYGSGMQNNWDRLGTTVQNLNNADSSFMLFRAMEASIKNSEDDVVHALLYPSVSDPFCYNFFLDGGGDISSTSNTIVQTLTNLTAYNGFCYAAHPFAEKDDLSFFIGGGIWNLGDSLFAEDDMPFPTLGTVICNDLALPSDIYSDDTNYLFKKGLKGGEIWNDRNSLSTTDDEHNPWNVTNSGSITPYAPIDSSNSIHHYYRFIQGLDITDFLQKKSLKVRNAKPNIKNWKFFIAAGSDAHGSFNYSNTELTFGVSGMINDNAVGKLTTLAFCPDGMGHNGVNVLHALENGNTILSDGPIVNLGISTDGIDTTNEIYIGQDTVFTYQQLVDAKMVVDAVITPEFGNISQITLTGITSDSIYYYELPLASHQVYALQDILNNIFGSVPDGQYFMLRASLHSVKNYGALSDIYKRTSDRFFSITNPIWIKTSLITGISWEATSEEIILKPNPVSNRFFINLPGNENYMVKIFDLKGQLVQEEFYSDQGVDVKNLPSGFYMATFLSGATVINKKIIINH